MANSKIVRSYARVWPREVFEKFPPPDGSGKQTIMAKALKFLDGPGVYILYRDDEPYYIGQATRLRSRLWRHAIRPEGRYYHFWNYFSAFAVPDKNLRNELEGILIAAMPTANSAKPRIQKEEIPKEVRTLLREIYRHRLPLRQA